MDEFKQILQRIKEFLLQNEPKVTERLIAQKLDINPEYLSRCKAKGHIPYEKVVNFCHQNGLDINYILYGSSARVQEDRNVVKIKLLNDIFGSCGGGGEQISHEYEWINLDKQMLDSMFPTLNPKHLESIKAVGDSMEPAIKDGTIVFFDKNDTNIQKPGIFVLRAGDAIFIKRVNRGIDGNVELISDNSIYPIQRVDPQEVYIIGRVLGSIDRF